MRCVFLPAALLALAGCAQFQSSPGVVVQPTLDWRSMATLSDRDRLRDWRSAFVAALRAARAGGHSADLEREGVLLEPDAALGGGPIHNGAYRCRVIKVGAKSEGMLNYIAYPAFDCRIQQARAMQYARDTERDVAGFVERIGPNRWRLIMPRPHFESQMDVMELVPSSSGVR